MLDPCIEIIDERFRQLVHGNVHMDKLWTGGRWCEGPAYLPAGKYLIWSDIPNDRVMRWDECSGEVTEFEAPARNQNGHTVDAFGRLVSCEHRGRCVSRIEFDGTRTILADQYHGKRLNSPNDVVVKSDGSIWFTDPTYGIDSHYEGDKSEPEQDGSYVYRIDPDGTVTKVVDDMVKPNGLAFSVDESLLYVCDTGRSHVPGTEPAIRAYDVSEAGTTVSGGRELCVCDAGAFDGFRVDRSGNLWTSAADGVHCYTPSGGLLGKIHTPEVVANLCFGGVKKNRLFICGTTSIYAIYVNAQGAT